MLGSAVERMGQNYLHIMDSGLLGSIFVLFQFSLGSREPASSPTDPRLKAH